LPVTTSVPFCEPRRPTLMVSPSRRVAGLAEDAVVERSPRSRAHCRSLTVPLTAMPSSSPVIRNEIDPFGAAAAQMSEAAARAGDRALHVDRAAAVERAPHDLAANGGCVQVLRRRAAPRRYGRRSTDAARRADAGVEVLDRRGAGLGEGDAVDRQSRT
jgi:hypothetical protein